MLAQDAADRAQATTLTQLGECGRQPDRDGGPSAARRASRSGAAHSALAEGYLRSTPGRAGAGIVDQTMQFHGGAVRYAPERGDARRDPLLDRHRRPRQPGGDRAQRRLRGARRRRSPMTWRTSVVHTRQGNPAWADQERDAVSPIRSDDLFYGARLGDPQPDWVDLEQGRDSAGRRAAAPAREPIVLDEPGRKPCRASGTSRAVRRPSSS